MKALACGPNDGTLMQSSAGKAIDVFLFRGLFEKQDDRSLKTVERMMPPPINSEPESYSLRAALRLLHH